MRLRAHLILAGVAVLLVSFGFAFSEAAAGSGPGNETAASSPPIQIENSSCFFCHSDEELSIQFDNGDVLPLTINADLFAGSTHGSSGLDCVDCHSDIKTFPHPERTSKSYRDFKLDYYTICRDCHEEQFNLTLDSVHQRELAAGNNEAAVCTDCHNPHTQQYLTNDSGELLDYARLHIPETCSQCHSAIYDTYKESVHGSALTQQGNLDVPTCIDCHGVHNIQSPNTVTFRNSTPFLCAECHTNNALMHKYGLSTDVLNTYVADFHGTTVVLFDKSFPDQPTNKPVCTDCHGVHDIVRADDPNKGLETRENLLVRCQQCHPDATTNFPDSWMSHYIPSPEKYPIVYYVNLFYKFFIPAVLGPMAVLVVMDFGRMMVNRFRKPKQVAKEEPAAVTESQSAVEVETVEETSSTKAKAEPEWVEEMAVVEPEEENSKAEPTGEEPESSEKSKTSDEEEKTNDN
jgi:predicted CXXCH cytochrome family protein